MAQGGLGELVLHSLIVGATEAVTVVALTSLLLPFTLRHVVRINLCLETLEQLAREAHSAVHAIDQGSDASIYQRAIQRHRHELGRAITAAFRGQDDVVVLTTLMTQLALALKSAEPSSPPPAAGSRWRPIETIEQDLKQEMLSFASRYLTWKYMRGLHLGH